MKTESCYFVSRILFPCNRRHETMMREKNRITAKIKAVIMLQIVHQNCDSN